jgi:hypothetical protein
VPAADKRGHPVSDKGSLALRHIVDLHPFDETVDDDDLHVAAIDQGLLRHRNPDENIAGARIGLLQRIGEFIDPGDRDPLPLDRPLPPGPVSPGPLPVLIT